MKLYSFMKNKKFGRIFFLIVFIMLVIDLFFVFEWKIWFFFSNNLPPFLQISICSKSPWKTFFEFFSAKKVTFVSLRSCFLLKFLGDCINLPLARIYGNFELKPLTLNVFLFSLIHLKLYYQKFLCFSSLRISFDFPNNWVTFVLVNDFLFESLSDKMLSSSLLYLPKCRSLIQFSFLCSQKDIESSVFW